MCWLQHEGFSFSCSLTFFFLQKSQRKIKNQFPFANKLQGAITMDFVFLFKRRHNFSSFSLSPEKILRHKSFGKSLCLTRERAHSFQGSFQQLLPCGRFFSGFISQIPQSLLFLVNLFPSTEWNNSDISIVHNLGESVSFRFLKTDC